jgi:hypothetical protein
MFWKNVIEKVKTHITYEMYFSENCAIWSVVRENMAEPDRPWKMQHDMV